MVEASGCFKLIKAGRLLDGLGGPALKNGAVLLKGSKVCVVGRQGVVAVPEGAEVRVFDYPDQTVMPGMVDAHTHHNGFGDGRKGDDLATLPDEVLTLQSARNARTTLFTGVTSIRENGPKNATMLRLKDAVNQGFTVGPRMVLCGRPVAIVGGHMYYMGIQSTGSVQARTHTRRLIKEGADYIKITATGGSTNTSFPLRPSFNVDELGVIVEEAHKFGKLTAAHCSSTQGIINSLDAGVDMIIHCVFVDPDGTHNFRADVADRIAEQGAVVNPTLHTYRSMYWILQEKKERQGLTLQETAKMDSLRGEFDARIEDCNKLIGMGIDVVTGSDSSWGAYKLGNTPYELECLTMAGYSDSKAVVSVTSLSAKAIGIDGEVGTLEPGKVADIIVVNGKPDEDVSALWDVRDVFFDGELVDRGSVESRANIRQRIDEA